MALADCSENKTGPAEFMLMGFWALPGLKPVFFLIFLTFYVLTIMWNFVIIVTITCNICLHMPMYFYLGNLSLLEILYTTNIVPFMLYDLLTKHATVSVTDCLTQMFIFVWLACTECFLLTSMAYDRYVAICAPLRYTTVMNQALCLRLAIGSWVLSSMPASITMSFLSRIHISGYNEIDHFFCDFAPFLKAACTDTTLLEIVSFLVCFIVTSIPFTLIMLSYAYIIVAILRIPSNTGRHKVFSTCSSHITVVAMYFGTLIAIYVAPRETKTIDFNKLVSLMYTMVTPLLNPIIYTLRNTDMIEAMKKTFYKDF